MTLSIIEAPPRVQPGGPVQIRAAFLVLSLLSCAAWSAQGPQTDYHIGLERRASQELEVEARFEGVTGREFRFHLPVWRTGLYLVLDPVGTLS
ncbi:MAG: hypothetical protein V2I63_06870, partial [Pseudomonadales bacterium]|nr:hypothetical protein [Pseudomonadales bacterium]